MKTTRQNYSKEVRAGPNESLKSRGEIRGKSVFRWAEPSKEIDEHKFLGWVGLTQRSTLTSALLVRLSSSASYCMFVCLPIESSVCLLVCSVRKSNFPNAQLSLPWRVKNVQLMLARRCAFHAFSQNWDPLTTKTASIAWITFESKSTMDGSEQVKQMSCIESSLPIT